MKELEQFYFNQFWKAIEAGNDELAEEIERKYSRLVTDRESKTVVKTLLVVLAGVVFSPVLWWWVIGWR